MMLVKQKMHSSCRQLSSHSGRPDDTFESYQWFSQHSGDFNRSSNLSSRLSWQPDSSYKLQKLVETVIIHML